MIGIFDSGVGGLTVLKAIREKAPNADLIYFGDTENAPYGNKGRREIANLIAMALRRLHKEGATHIVSACNSASVPILSLPIDLLRLRLFDVIEMVEPTVETLASRGKKITLFGTKATVDSGMYQKAFRERGIEIDAIALPTLAGLIEGGASSEEMYPIVREAVSAAIGTEILSLSCTHYPFVRELFERAVQEGEGVAEVFDPASAVAEEVAVRFPTGGGGKLRFLISKESTVFNAYAERLFKGISYTIEPAGSIYWALKERL
jgi:glutamate racemase